MQIMGLIPNSVFDLLPWLITSGILLGVIIVLRNQRKQLGQHLSQQQEQSDHLNREKAALEERLAARETKITELISERDQARSESVALSQAKGAAVTELASLQSRMEEERKAAADKIALLETAEKRLTLEFENLANRIFEEKQQKFNDTSKTHMEALLSPVRQQLVDFRKKVEDVYDSENRERASLRAEIGLLKTLNERIGQDALNLTKALKGDSKVRGNWGEVRLERLLEQSGLVKGREYEVQTSLRNSDGVRFQPDVIVHLPENKDVIIDAKVSLVAYERFHAAEEDAERGKYIKEHITSLRSHINALGVKNYEDLTGINTLDLVILFVPIEPALLLALENEPNLQNEAFDRQILLVSPTTLMGTLQIIYNIWRYEYQNRNALVIATDAGRLYDQFVLFTQALEKIGEQLNKALEAYEIAHKRLSSGRGNLVGRTQNLKVLGAKAKKSLATELLETAAENSEDPEFTET